MSSDLSRAAAALAWLAAGLLAFAAAATRGFDDAPSLSFAAAATAVGLVCWAFAGAALSREPPARRLGWVDSGLSPGVLVGLVLGMLAASQLAEWAIQIAGYQEVGNLPRFRRALRGATGQELAVALVAIGVLPGFAEEVALRGFVQRGLERRTGAVTAVGVTSLLFAALHGEPVHAAGALVLGLYLGTVVALCGSIRPAVLCHVANNVVATLGAAVTIPAATGLVTLAGLVAGPWALWRLVLRRRAAHARDEAARARAEAADAPDAAADASDAAARGSVARSPLGGSPEPGGEGPAPPPLEGSLREPDGR